MKKACLFTENCLVDIIFEMPYFAALKEAFLARGVELNTQKYVNEDEAEFILYFNMPLSIPVYPEKSYVWLAEPPVIYRRNFKPHKFKSFKKIFTWSNAYIAKDPEKFVKLNYPQEFLDVDFDLSKKEKLCAIVTKNKASTRQGELFSERLAAIRWFEKHAPDEFDLYGGDWEKGALDKFLGFFYHGSVPKNYKGAMGDKVEELKKYKFSICYENWKNNVGYITEKIFDAFKSSNVPIYLGEKNIDKYIPSNCYIKKSDFKTYDKLYKFLKNMDDSEYLNYLENIQKYIKSEAAHEFSTEAFIDTILGEVL